MTEDEIRVRRAQKKDIPQLINIEHIIWKPLGTPVFNAGYFMTWLKVNPEGFFVAECDGMLVGYTYTQIFNFVFEDVENFTSFDAIADHAYTTKTHNPAGNALFGVTITSTRKGAGRKLHEAILKYAQDLKKEYFVAATRLSGLSSYINMLIASGYDIEITTDLEKEVALWYAIECTKMLNGKIWDVCDKQPDIKLPQPEKPDSVIAAHLSVNKEFGLAALLPEFMQDPQSKNYAILNVYKLSY